MPESVISNYISLRIVIHDHPTAQSILLPVGQHVSDNLIMKRCRSTVFKIESLLQMIIRGLDNSIDGHPLCRTLPVEKSTAYRFVLDVQISMIIDIDKHERSRGWTEHLVKIASVSKII